MKYTIDDIAIECHRTSEEHGFWKHELLADVISNRETVVRNPSIIGEKLALIHSEVSEALEESRGGGSREGILEELSDVIIRVLDLAVHIQNGETMTIGEMLRHKMDKNEGREHLHGKSF